MEDAHFALTLWLPNIIIGNKQFRRSVSLKGGRKV